MHRPNFAIPKRARPWTFTSSSCPKVSDARDKPIIDWSKKPEVPAKKYYIDKGSVQIAAHLVYELDTQGKQLRVVQFTDYTADNVRRMYPSAAVLRSKWSNAEEREAIIQTLEKRGVSLAKLAEESKQPDADPFDLLCHVAFNSPLRTRRERAEMLRKEKKDFLEQYGPDARAVLNEMLDKYIEYGEAQFQIPAILKLPALDPSPATKQYHK